jgi:hypothetical protein
MRTRRLILVIAVYVGLDLANPFMPGAFLFDPAESVDGVHGERARPPLLAPGSPATAPGLQADGLRPAPRRPARVARQWLAEPRPAHVQAVDPPPNAEDH